MSGSQGPSKGFWGKILHVNLSTKGVEYEQLDESFFQKYLGGIGLAAKVLWDRIKPGIDPLGPDNVLGFVPGLLTDTGSLFTGRFLAVAKSPATGGWGEANCGGFFSPSLKRCGIDGVFVHGASAEPVYLLIEDNKAEVKDALDLWGTDAIETERILKERHGKRSQVACIGQAGERLSYLAGICNDGGRIAARSGMGTVMGSKKLKAVVAVGTQKVPVVDSAQMKQLSKEFSEIIKKGKGSDRMLNDRLLGFSGKIGRRGGLYPRQPVKMWRQLLYKFGTPSLTAMSAENGDSPIKNWGGIGYLDFPLDRSQKLGAETVISHEVKKYGCFSCPVRCGGIVKMDDAEHPIKEMHKPEYETICSFGALLLNDDLSAVFRLNDMLNRAAIDSISVGGVMAFAIECFENGILNKNDTGGIELNWGNADGILKMVQKIIDREGLGDILADGVKKAAEKIGKGSEKYAVHCGGIEAPMHDPKFDPGFLTSYYCEPAPGRHTTTSLQYIDLQYLEKQFSRAKKPPSVCTAKTRYRADDKGEILVVGSYYKMLIDCTGTCMFGTQIGGPIPLCGWMNAATGWNLTNDQYLIIGERIEQLRHAFNVREGLNPIRDFKPNPRVYGDPPLLKGPAKNRTLDVKTMARSFYAAMHWNVENGKPEEGHLKQLGLDEVVEEFYKKG
ncbi:MAG: aldehyde ferredoxin oxidoreductase family protein [Pseudomonadota bacterium]